MKKLAGLLLCLYFAFAAHAQSDLKKKIIDSTCACLTETPDISKKSPEELQVIIGECMMKKSMEDFMALAQERNIELNDIEGMKKLGMEVGLDLAKSDCKVISSIMMTMAQSKMSKSDNKTDEIKEQNLVKGKVENVEVKDFIYITVSSGPKLIQLVWSDYVTSGDNYAKNLTQLKNKPVEFSYVTKEVYSIKAKAYVTVKMITGMK